MEPACGRAHTSTIVLLVEDFFIQPNVIEQLTYASVSLSILPAVIQEGRAIPPRAQEA